MPRCKSTQVGASAALRRKVPHTPSFFHWDGNAYLGVNSIDSLEKLARLLIAFRRLACIRVVLRMSSFNKLTQLTPARHLSACRRLTTLLPHEKPGSKLERIARKANPPFTTSFEQSVKTDQASAVLRGAQIDHEVFWTSGELTVYISSANQLFGEKRVFDSNRFRKEFRGYEAWEAHHVVEAQDLERLGIAHKFPPYDNQTCVLLPAGGHRGRINARLRVTAPIGAKDLTTRDLLKCYADAYAVLGNYCGSPESTIVAELMSIVELYLG
jgi:hypothetical protein